MKQTVALRVALLLVALLAATVSVQAVICDSFDTLKACDGIITDSGKCYWDSEIEMCLTDTSYILPQGMVAITSIEDDGEVVQLPPPGIIFPMDVYYEPGME